MDNSLYYLAVNRQVGLSAELDMIANNIANLDTTGFRREGVAFTEFVVSAEVGESVSMADLGARYASEAPGVLTMTGGRLDVAIEGDGYFLVDGPEGRILTRAGSFLTSQEGFLVTPVGDQVLDIGEAPIVIPPDAVDVVIGPDGTISANGEPVAQIAVMTAPRELISRFGDTAFQVEGDAYEPVAAPKVRQGALEQSNVDAVLEIARMIEVTRAYESAQSLIEDEDERINSAIQTLGRNA